MMLSVSCVSHSVLNVVRCSTRICKESPKISEKKMNIFDINWYEILENIFYSNIHQSYPKIISPTFHKQCWLYSWKKKDPKNPCKLIGTLRDRASHQRYFVSKGALENILNIECRSGVFDDFEPWSIHNGRPPKIGIKSLTLCDVVGVMWFWTWLDVQTVYVRNRLCGGRRVR